MISIYFLCCFSSIKSKFSSCSHLNNFLYSVSINYEKLRLNMNKRGKNICKIWNREALIPYKWLHQQKSAFFMKNLQSLFIKINTIYLFIYIPVCSWIFSSDMLWKPRSPQILTVRLIICENMSLS